MRTLLFLILLFVFQNMAISQNEFYSYTPEGKVGYALSTKKLLIQFDERLTFNQKRALLQPYKALRPLEPKMLLPAPKVAILSLKPGTSAAQTKELLENLLKKEGIVFANPFLIDKDGIAQSFVSKFVVGLKTETDLPLLKEFAKKWRIEKIEQDQFMPAIYHLTVPNKTIGDALNLANIFYESGLFKFAEPDFLKLLKKMSTDDPYVKHQWALQNTGQCIVSSNNQCSNLYGTSGADLKITDAWTITTGSPNIKIAVIDEGVDLNHPDLTGNILPGYDATGLGSAGAPQADDAHGTACAGIIAARGDNHLGIAGIAYNSKIIPIRIAYSDEADDWITQNSWQAMAINWAWQTAKADILSSSWGGGSGSSLVDNAIYAAANTGRNGKGVVIFFSAGNNNSRVSYPARNSLTIAVGASSMCDQRKRSSDDPEDMEDDITSDPLGVSCDKELWWGSNYGTNLDVAAPGVKIYTTDISGSKGYKSGDYVANFNGTSSACPNAAGVMALILSVNPNLTRSQARQLLESTCDKVGGYTYTNNGSQPNGTWSDDLGYGRVNAFRAVQAAQSTLTAGNSDEGITLQSSITTTPGAIIRNQSFQVSFSVRNNSAASFTGSISIDLLKATNGSDAYLRELGIKNNLTICSNCNSSTLSYAATITESPSNYRLAVYYLPNGESDWKLASIGNFLNPIAITVSEINNSLTVTPTTLNFNAAGGSLSATLNTTTSWAASSNQPWATITPASGIGNKTLSITCQANTSTSSRSAIVTVTGGDQSKTVSITQAGNTALVCNAPTNLNNFLGVYYSHFWVAWDTVPGVENYNIRMRRAGSTEWTNARATSLNYTVYYNIPANTTYEFQVQSICSNVSTSAWSPSFFTTTLGADDPYCYSYGSNDRGNLRNIIVADTDFGAEYALGYTNHTNKTATVEAGKDYPVSVSAFLADRERVVYWRVWIDYNQDHDFDDPNELVFDTTTTQIDKVIGRLNIPANVPIGKTRMRVAIDLDANNGPCQTGNNREVIDYTVEIKASTAFINLSPATLSFIAAGGNQSIAVASNINWTASSNQPWLQVSPTTGTNSATLAIACQANPATTSRTAIITVQGGNMVQTISVTQLAASPALAVSPLFLWYENAGGTQAVFVNSNTNWTASGNPSWVSATPAGAFGNRNLLIICQPNTTNNARTASIKISSAESTQTISIYQQGQVLSMVTIASAGTQSAENQLGYLQWTLGEAVIETIGSNILLTQGFHQTFATLTNTKEALPALISVAMFPNPAVDLLHLNITAPYEQSIELTLFDIEGKILLTKKLSGWDIKERLDITQLPAGIYLLALKEFTHTWQTAQQIIKIK